MSKLTLICTLFILTLTVFGQDDPKTAVGKLGPNPFFIIDSQKVKQSDLSKYNADSITSVIMLYDTTATKLYGDSAKDGAVIIETRSFARDKYISFFRKFSQPYDSLYTAIGSDTAFAYIINDKIQKGNYEGNLSAITQELFMGIEILTKEQLYTRYDINDKLFRILVHSKKPKDLYNADKKF
ncbi:MAG TPA: hypothetical protein VIJ92_03730 [Ginsengibacter sp.]